MPTDDDDDDLLAQIGQLGAAMNAARDETLDPDVRAAAQHAAEAAAAKLPRDAEAS